MKIYFLRHGQADWPDWTGPDDERPLTRKGRKEMKRVAKFLHEIEVDATRILSSPLPRAFQTAKIVAKELDREVEEEPALGKGFRLHKLRRILERTGDDDVMIVGHEPDFSIVLTHLTGGHVKLAKAGLARVDLATPQSDGTLVWLLSPKCCRLR